jgi:ABC-type dipeptide/oligopeptide/nickel transport system ATPase component
MAKILIITGNQGCGKTALSQAIINFTVGHNSIARFSSFKQFKSDISKIQIPIMVCIDEFLKSDFNSLEKWLLTNSTIPYLILCGNDLDLCFSNFEVCKQADLISIHGSIHTESISN